MSLTHEPAGPKILEKIKIYILSRAKLLFSLCHEIPCTKYARLLTYTPQRTHPYVYVRCNGLLMPPLIPQLTDKIDEYYTHFYLVRK